MEGEVKITIVDTRKDGDNGTAINSKTGEPNKKLATNTDEKNNDGTIEKSVWVNQVFNALKRDTIQIAEYNINKYVNLTDNFKAQEDLSVAKQIISKGTNIATATIAGAKVGGLVGALVGFAISTTNQVISTIEAYDQQNIKFKQQDTQLAFTQERAGYSLTSGSIGENR